MPVKPSVNAAREDEDGSSSGVELEGIDLEDDPDTVVEEEEEDEEYLCSQVTRQSFASAATWTLIILSGLEGGSPFLILS